MSVEVVFTDYAAGFLLTGIGTSALGTASGIPFWKLRFRLKRASGVVVKYNLKALEDHLPSLGYFQRAFRDLPRLGLRPF